LSPKILTHNGHVGVFLEHSSLSGLGTTIPIDVYKCHKCELCFIKDVEHFFAVVKRFWSHNKYDYFWAQYDYPKPGVLWACDEKDRIIQEII